MTTTLVIGLGFIGRVVASHLVAEGITTATLTRSAALSRVPGTVASHVGDCSDPDTLHAALQDVGAVVYCAGGLMPASSDINPVADLGRSLAPLVALLDQLAARQYPPAFVYLSSGGTVYGAARYLPIDENHPTQPTNSYGILKLAAEHFCQRYGRGTGAPVTVLRCSNVYGPGQRVGQGQGAVGEFAYRISEGASIPVFGDGSTLRDYVHVADVAQGVAASLTQLRDGEPRILNLSSSEGTSVVELISLIETAIGRSARVDHRPARSSDGGSNVLCNQRLRDLLGLAPRRLSGGLEFLAEQCHAGAETEVLSTT